MTNYVIFDYFNNKYPGRYPNYTKKMRTVIKDNPILLDSFLRYVKKYYPEDYLELDEDSAWVVDEDLTNLFSRRRTKRKSRRRSKRSAKKSLRTRRKSRKHYKRLL